MVPKFGAEIDGWEWAIRLDPDIMKNVSLEWSNEMTRVVD